MAVAAIGKINSRRTVPVMFVKPPANPLPKKPVQAPGSKLIGIFASVGEDSKKVVEYLGPEMVNQIQWYTAVYWNTFEANWSEGAGFLTSDGTNGSLVKTAFWTLGHKYRVKFSVVRIAGTLFGPYDGSGTSGSLSATGSITYDYIPDSGGPACNMMLYSSGFNGDLTELSIKEVLKKEIDE